MGVWLLIKILVCLLVLARMIRHLQQERFFGDQRVNDGGAP